MKFIPRLDRFYPLREAASYPGSPFIDLVLFLPASGQQTPVPLRLWLKTSAPSPEIEINNRRFKPFKRSEQDSEWVDFGVIEEGSQILGAQPFGIIRFYGLSAQEAQSAWFVSTPQTQAELSGSIDEVERLLCGISRADVGCTTIIPCRTEVGAPATFTLHYTTGSLGLPPGSLLRLAFPLAFSLPQTENPDQPGFLAVEQANVPIEVVSIGTSGESHEQVDAIYRLPEGLEPGGQLQFSYHTEFVYLYATKKEAMEREYWWFHLPPMAVAVAVDERQLFVPPLEMNGHGAEFTAGEPSRLHLFLPGRIRSSEEVALSGLFTDRYRNIPAYGPIPCDFLLKLEGPQEVNLGTPAGQFIRWNQFRIPLPKLQPGVYRVKAIEPSLGTVVAVSNPMQIMLEESELPSIYWGEIHGHTVQSDGSGDYESLFRQARKMASLDFAAAADHACYFTDNEWQWMQDVVNANNRPGQFISLIGYEWAGQQGHRNIYTSADRLKLFRGMTPGTDRLDVVYDNFRGQPEIVGGPHTVHTYDFFALHDPAVQRFMEIYSMWGDVESYAFEVLSRSAKIGFTGGGDCHEGRVGFSVEDPDGQGITPHTFSPGLRYKCGLTAALLPELSRQALISALQNHRTYATTGARILIDFSISGIPMGDEGSVYSSPRIHASVHACSPIATIQIIRDGTIVHTLDQPQIDTDFTWVDPNLTPGEHWYLLKLTQQDGERAWTSPIWVKKEN